MDWLNRKTLFLLVACLCVVAFLTNWKAKRNRQQVLQDLSRKLDTMNDSLIAMRTANDQLIGSIRMLKLRYKDRLGDNKDPNEQVLGGGGVPAAGRPAVT